jgi:hypothetical protein
MIEVAKIQRTKVNLLREASRTSFDRGLDQLRSLERYERRALSRRKFALRAFALATA